MKAFTKKIGVYRAEQTTNANGQPVEELVFVCNRLASMNDPKAQEKKLTGVEAVEEQVTHTFTMVFPLSLSINAKYTLKYRDRWFSVTGVVNWNEENRLLVVTATEVVGEVLS